MIQFHKPYITIDEITEVLDSLRGGWITMGPKTIEFENKFKEYLGSKNAVSMNSCTACLHLALKAIGLREGDEVIVPTVTFTATAEVVTYFNARPVLVDVEEDTYNLNPKLIKGKITKKTKAIMPVHFAGQICDMDEICRIAKKHDLLVIEDAAHAMPAWYKNRKIGTIGDISCFSFYATKSLTTGEGGMATTENDDWAGKMRVSRLHGISKDAWKRYTGEGSWFYEVESAGYKYNMTDIQAAMGLAQLRKIEWMWERRKEIAGIYTEAFASRDDIEPPYVKADRESGWHLYVVKLNLKALSIGRNQFIEELRKRGIMTSVHFIPLHKHPYYITTFNYDRRDFKAADSVYERIISLPIYPGMSNEEVGRVIYSVEDVLQKFRA
ncbi:MAG: UDP-4-amino-4,6-dideoxy-N-acetyl-beta-L-altrosamine transaminase [Nitrospirae bacterium GWC2_42_7]|nr:MAG: UDP-4-amino-4,6-dideoxy-N-acetyl-beta-L-altrosamine transaminase [Nitrospirae bacterium GWC2_42_7]